MKQKIQFIFSSLIFVAFCSVGLHFKSFAQTTQREEVPDNPWYGYTKPEKYKNFGYQPESHKPLAYKINNYHYLYIGVENDHPKSWTFMGGALSPGKNYPIQY